MDEKFLHKISGILNDPPEVPFDESAWDRMQKKLYPAPSRRKWMIAALAALLFLLWLIPAGISYVAFQRLDEANDNIAELKTIIQETKILPSETHPEHRSLVIYDTIYKTVIIENIKTQNAPSGYFTPQSSLALLKNDQYSPYRNHALSFNNYQPFKSPFSFFSGNSDNYNSGNLPPETVVELSPPEAIDYLSIKSLDYYFDPNLQIVSDPFIQKNTKKGLRYYLYKMQPESFALSGNVGQYIATYGTGRGVNFTSGLEAEIGYKKNFGLVIGGEYMQWKFDKSRDHEEEEEEEEEHKLENQFPTVQPDSDDDVLNEVYGDFKYVQVPIGIRYTFSNGKALKPSVGLGLAARYPLHSALTYEFLSNFDEYTRDLENVLEEKFELKSAWASVGLQYELNDHWNFALDGRALMDFDKGNYDYENLRLFSLRIGMQYVF